MEVEPLAQIIKWKFPSSIGNWTLIGSSRAADSTFFNIPELEWQFDAGPMTRLTHPEYIFLTHTHSDHAYMLPCFKSRGKPPKVLLPIESHEYVDNYLKVAQMLTSHDKTETQEKSYELIDTQPNDIFPLGKDLEVKIFAMDHQVPCVGFGFYRYKDKLKVEYHNLDRQHILNLKKEGVTITEKSRQPLFVYLGDTTIKAFEINPELLTFPFVIVECTFLNHTNNSHQVKHIVWEQLEPYVKSHPEVTFILIHFSKRYKNTEIKEFFNHLPFNNIIVWID
jgi:ribonuclease Z